MTTAVKRGPRGLLSQSAISKVEPGPGAHKARESSTVFSWHCCMIQQSQTNQINTHTHTRVLFFLPSERDSTPNAFTRRGVLPKPDAGSDHAVGRCHVRRKVQTRDTPREKSVRILGKHQATKPRPLPPLSPSFSLSPKRRIHVRAAPSPQSTAGPRL